MNPFVQATVELIMLWVDDGRSVSIGGRLSAEAANHTSSCTKPCFKGTNAAQGCCDRIWLPTLQFDNALPNLAVCPSSLSICIQICLGGLASVDI